MVNTLISLVEPAILYENRLTIHRFLRESCNAVSGQLQQGLFFFKEEFRQLQQEAETCFNNMLLPVNNFLKDPLHIEKEVKSAATGCTGKNSTGTIIPIEIALQSPMEENY
jgi:hypothetical protein